MTITLVFIAVMMAIFGGWLFSHSINVRPWEAAPADTGSTPMGRNGQLPPGVTAPRVGLAVFVAVATALFALTISAYLMRMEMGHDWRTLPTPGLLWLNTACLVLGSIALQWAWNGARRGDERSLRLGLGLGGGFTIAFVLGQGLAWQQLNAAGYYLVENPANAFFFLLTALHALHLLGGLAAWARTLFRVQRGAAPAAVRASVELCALYWHFLLLLWVVLFALLLNT
ncbi:cytochrome oxidase subunit III [Halomonas campisalis]|uniref:Cytochrome oxidase subunit III n=1 Tax=Billgrantia campisalis TaxID=74661 RepID=A0ABS9P715_9GAMM|nr:cytochrome c oxidase subunit 3 [Halomonas campisalis]MCG6657022.1 cytochrome oxidase subunit III [Halomonas campisalis]MDR5862207.1 cytochrome c oxidase subunit 3 [Halomonas campisalis]